MADKKISQLTGATTPLAGTEVLPIVQGGSTVKVSVANLTAGRTVDATTVNATTVDATNVEVTNIKAKDGTAAATIADSTGVVTATANPVLNAGTVNGVVYLNASKAATSGSDLVFDGANLGVGIASPENISGYKVIQAQGSTQGGIFQSTTGSYTTKTRLYSTDGGGVVGTSSNHALAFLTNDAERGRITAGGFSKFSNDGTYTNITGSYHELRSSIQDQNVAIIRNTNATSPYGINITFSGAAPDNNTNLFLACGDTVADRLFIYSDGDLANHDGVYGQISDQKLKQDIVDAPSQWNDLKAVRFRKYRMKTDVEADPNAPALLGVIAQELEQVCPGLVDEHPDMEMVEVTDEEGNVTQTQQPTGTTTKTVKSSILLMKAAVALQEAMVRIEQLEAKVAALEDK